MPEHRKGVKSMANLNAQIGKINVPGKQWTDNILTGNIYITQGAKTPAHTKTRISLFTVICVFCLTACLWQNLIIRASHRPFHSVLLRKLHPKSVHSYTARLTLPDLRHLVQAYTFLGVPSTIALTRLMLGFQALLARLWEWETLIPKVTPLPQTSHFAI